MDGVQADDFSGEMEAENLFLTFVIDHVALETAGANGSNRAKFIARSKQVFAGLYGPGAVNDLLEPFGLVG
jgi:hypothetical protein